MAPFKSTATLRSQILRSGDDLRSLLLSTSSDRKSEDYFTCFFSCCLQTTRAHMRAAASGVSLLFFHISDRKYRLTCLCFFSAPFKTHFMAPSSPLSCSRSPLWRKDRTNLKGSFETALLSFSRLLVISRSDSAKIFNADPPPPV